MVAMASKAMASKAGRQASIENDVGQGCHGGAQMPRLLS